MKKGAATNTFNKGLIMDLNPMVTPSDSVVNCLNGTLVTYNGNENVLQNDMGNGRVETAYLPSGYIPLGTATLGGIMYIVSYNPITNKSQIGSFPSPERNLLSDELSDKEAVLNLSSLKDEKAEDTEAIHFKSNSKKLILLDKELHPGDKFLIACTPLNDYQNILSAYQTDNTNPDKYPKYLKFSVVSIQDDGVLRNMNNSLVWHANELGDYFIVEGNILGEEQKVNLDEYRGLINSNYSVFNSRVEGKLAILAELECIDSFDISWDAVNTEGEWDIYFYVNWTYNNSTSPDKINLYGIRIIHSGQKEAKQLILNYPYINSNESEIQIGSTDIVKRGVNTTFCTPMYIDSVLVDTNPYEENNKITTPRKNDGTDNQFLIKDPIHIKDKDSIDFTIYPMMPFGCLDWLKRSFSINVKDLGSGKIELIEYRYFFNDTSTDGSSKTCSIVLNWGLDAYLEKNKKINEIKFNFQKYDNNIELIVKANAGNIQDNYSVGGIWNETETSDDINLNNIAYSYSINNKSSYSGNFSEKITKLDSDSLYFVQIYIDYDGTAICYYRFMYTFDVFNDQYYKCKDFKNLDLNEALKGKLALQTESKTITNEEFTDKCINSSGNEVMEFPGIFTNNDKSKYNIKRTYSCDLSFDVSGKTSFSGFNLKISKITGQDGKNITYTQTPENPKQTSITYDNITGTTTTLDPIKYNSSYTGTTYNTKFPNFNGKYEMELTVPLEIDHSRQTNIAVEYQLENLSVKCGWLTVYGMKKRIHLCYSPYYMEGRLENQGEYALQQFNESTGDGSDPVKIQDISKYYVIAQALREHLKEYDILALRFRTHHESDGGTQKKYHFWGYGNVFSDSDRLRADKTIWYNSETWSLDEEAHKNGDVNPNLIIFACLDTQDNIRLFTYGIDYKFYSYDYKGINVKKFHGMRYLGSDDDDNSWHTVTNLVFPLSIYGSRDDVEPSVESCLQDVFNGYYKVVKATQSSTSPDQRYKWKKLYYYDNFTWTDTISIPSKVEFVLKVNEEQELTSNTTIKNLNYTNTMELDIQTSVSNSENLENWVDKAIQAAESSSFIKLPDGEIKQTALNTKSIYTKDGELLSYLQQDFDSGFAGDSKCKISTSSERFRIDPVSIPAKQKITIAGRQEKQGIAIQNVIQINEWREKK